MSYVGRVNQKSSDIRRFDVTSSTSATHTLTWVAPNEQSLIVTINGVKQQEDAYSVSGTTLTLTDPLIATDKLEVIGINDLGTTITPAQNSITNDMVSSTAAIANSKMASDTTDASNISSGTLGTARMGSGTASSSTILYGDNTWAAPPAEYNDAGLQDDIALLGFKVASNGSLAKYNLVDQTVDDFQDTSGVNASSSTNEVRDSSGKYYAGEAVNTPTVTGGTITTDGSYTIHKFTADGTLATDTAQDYEVLIVGGGGGGGRQYGGGGGAGGLIYIDGYAVTAASHSVTVGDGGAGATSASGGGSNGEDSVFMNLTALGGGVGASNTGQHNVNTGGSGGGGEDGAGTHGTAAQSSTNDGHSGSGFGNNGAGGGSHHGGGGGGAGTVGGTANGGDGKQYDILVSGTNVYYAGGGGGGGGTSGATYGTGGQGGGGNGENWGVTGETVGAANTGGGGGGDGSGDSNGAAGGSGIVILRRPTSGTAPANMTLVSTTTAAQAAPTKGDIVLTYTNGAGTTTLDTDLTAEISADGGSTWTALALSSEGSTGSHNIATSHDVTISSTITAPYNMAYRIKTLNQSVSKTTRIQAVSLGWS